jgi:hypothetical protein
VFVRKNTGVFTKWVPVTELPEFLSPRCMAQIKVLKKLFNLILSKASVLLQFLQFAH